MLTIKQIFDLGLKIGMAADPRGPKGVQKYLDRIKKEYEDLRPEDKQYFDKEQLVNPYSDSRVHVGDLNAKVKRVLAGIDIGSGEILLASQLCERGKTIDLVMAHHPVGSGLANLHGVMDMTVDEYEKLGMPVHTAESLMGERIKEVGRSTHASNHYQMLDMAKLLKINVMNTHTITDNLINKFVREYIEKKAPETIGDLIKVILEIPEYHEAKLRGAGPRITAGSSKNRVGKFLLEMTGGTSPSNKVYQELSRAGVSTVIGMHMPEAAMEKVNEHHMNVVIAGHMSSDSLGMNLFLDELEKKDIEVVPCSGLIRVNRNKKK
ncbi:MAG: NGG1p interacting factor NIF3 [Candidatus Magasanikbacteria bacterium]